MENCCFNCRHWQGPKARIAERLKNDPRAITWSESGKCKEIKSELEIDLDFGWEGGYVRSVSTDPDFLCKLWMSEIETEMTT